MSESFFKELAVADHNATHSASRTPLSQRVDHSAHNSNAINTGADAPTLLPLGEKLDIPTNPGQYDYPPQPPDRLWDLRPVSRPNQPPRGVDRQPSPQRSPHHHDRFATRAAEDKVKGARREKIYVERVNYVFPDVLRYLNSPIVRARANDLLRLCRKASKDAAEEMENLMHGARINADKLREFLYRQEYGSKIRRQLLRVARAIKKQEKASPVLRPGEGPSRTAIMLNPQRKQYTPMSEHTLIEPTSEFVLSGNQWLGKQKDISTEMHQHLDNIVKIQDPDLLDAAICAQLEDTPRVAISSSGLINQDITQPIGNNRTINPLEAIDEHKTYYNAQQGFFMDAADPEKRKKMTESEKVLWSKVPKPIQQYLEWRRNNGPRLRKLEINSSSVDIPTDEELDATLRHPQN